jgi:hypothetical protein
MMRWEMDDEMGDGRWMMRWEMDDEMGDRR